MRKQPSPVKNECKDCSYWTQKTQEMGDCINPEMKIVVIAHTPMTGKDADHYNEHYMNPNLDPRRTIKETPRTSSDYSCKDFKKED